MTATVLLFAAGVLLVAIEIVVPGGILGVIGGLSLFGGVVAAFVELGSQGGMIATAVALVIGTLAVYCEFVLLPKTALIKKLSMTATVDGRSQPELAGREVIGREVVAATMLAPTGYVELDGRRYEAFCQSGQAAVGDRLRIIEMDTFRLIVIKPNSSS